MNKICGIYQIINPRGYSYIGQSRDIYSRWKSYKRLDCKKQPRLYNSLKKYGVKNHKYEVLEECNLNLLNEKEIFWDSKNLLKLNIYPCGRGMLYKKKIYEHIKIYQFDKSCNLIKIWNSEKEIYSNLSFKKINKTYSLNKIIFSHNFIWISENYCNLFLNKEIFIEKVLLKIKNLKIPIKRTNAQKLYLSKINLGKKHSESTKIKLSLIHKKITTKEKINKMVLAFYKSECYKKLRKPVLQYDLNNNFIKEWESITEATDYYLKNFNINPKSLGSKISLVCKGKRKKTHNHIWKYK